MAALTDLDGLYQATLAFRSSQEYTRLLQYVARFREYKPFNLFLVKLQQPGSGYVATPSDWRRKFGREIKRDARPIVILRPFGPITCVYDANDTTGTKPIPNVFEPFAANGSLDPVIWTKTVFNSADLGISIETVVWPTREAGQAFRLPAAPKERPRFGIKINRNLDLAGRYITLVHELAHVLCGHCGPTRKDGRDDRSGVSKDVREFEAESVAYLVAAQQRLETDHPRYLATYIGSGGLIPEIDVALVFSVANTIEELGRKRASKAQAEQASLLEQE